MLHAKTVEDHSNVPAKQATLEILTLLDVNVPSNVESMTIVQKLQNAFRRMAYQSVKMSARL